MLEDEQEIMIEMGGGGPPPPDEWATVASPRLLHPRRPVWRHGLRGRGVTGALGGGRTAQSFEIQTMDVLGQFHEFTRPSAPAPLQHGLIWGRLYVGSVRVPAALGVRV